MFENRRYDIIAFPHGCRTVVATVFRTDAAQVVKGVAAFTAADREEFVDVVGEGGRTIATVAPNGECV